MLAPLRRAAVAAPQRLLARRCLSTPSSPLSSVHVLGKDYALDEWSNTPPSILSRVGANLHTRPGHPLTTLRSLIASSLPNFTHLTPDSPVVTPYQNFDSLSFAPDHPGRSRSDTYYINRDHLLRTHTSAHEVETFASGADAWTLTADVYRRDEIDASHYPVFHQTEGARTFATTPSAMAALRDENAALAAGLARENIVITDCADVSPANPAQAGHDPAHAALVAANLKLHLNRLLLALFGPGAARAGAPLQVRWIEAFFPFTTPSFEVEVLFAGRWLEILGCGVVQQRTLDLAGTPERIGWAFGLGLERIAMVLYAIPDIRLFWSADARFTGQWAPGEVAPFRPYSRHPACFKDVSFWLPAAGMHDNDFCDLVREVAGDLVENVELVGRFASPSVFFRLTRPHRSTHSHIRRVGGAASASASTTARWTAQSPTTRRTP
jgi:phenylalanyl-tRNA synthetase alpha chain